MVQWPFRTVGINASSPTAPALARVACARNGPIWAPLKQRPDWS
jgi:hypothetical protein